MRGVTSAPAERVLDVVEFLSRPEYGGHRFSDVARELGLSQATAHSILKTLCDRGWATRDPISKSLILAPRLRSSRRGSKQRAHFWLSLAKPSTASLRQPVRRPRWSSALETNW